ncbi:MAG TPA: acyltransferase domain-containing protein, partial [Casimicrobiaceae bacterium]
MKLAMVFPGQGSQSVGMLAGLAASNPQVEETFREASAVLGWDVLGLVKDGPEAELNRTQRTQPALLAAGIAVWRVWRSGGGALPAMMAGHSLGEYAALVAADSIAFGDALR